MTGSEMRKYEIELRNKLNSALNNLRGEHKWYSSEDTTKEWIQAASDYMNLLIELDEFLNKDF